MSDFLFRWIPNCLFVYFASFLTMLTEAYEVLLLFFITVIYIDYRAPSPEDASKRGSVAGKRAKQQLNSYERPISRGSRISPTIARFLSSVSFFIFSFEMK